MMKKWELPYLKVCLLLSLVILSFVFAMFQGGFVSWFLFASFFPFALYIFMLMLYPFKKMKVHRTFHQREYHSGDEILVEIMIERKSKWPLLYLVMEDLIPPALMPNGRNSSKQLFFFVFRQSLKLSYRLPLVMRGEHVFQGIRLTTGDLLGFYVKKETFTCQDVLLIYPSYKRVEASQIEPLFEAGKQTAVYRRHPITSIISGVRQYMPGDGLSRIHWKATARKHEIMTKEFEERKSQDVMIIMDQRESPIFEEMVAFVASLSQAMLLQGIGVGFAGSHFGQAAVTIGKGEVQKRKIFYQLALITEKGSEVNVSSGFRGMGGDTMFFVVTAQLTEELLSSLRIWKGGGEVTIFLMQSVPKHEGNEEGSIEAKRRGMTCHMLFATDWKSKMKEEM